MSEVSSDALAAKLAELSQRFASRAVDEHVAIKRALDNGDRTAIAQRAHTLAGNAGMFGQTEIGAAALALEEAAETGNELELAASRLLGLLAAL